MNWISEGNCGGFTHTYSIYFFNSCCKAVRGCREIIDRCFRYNGNESNEDEVSRYYGEVMTRVLRMVFLSGRREGVGVVLLRVGWSSVCSEVGINEKRVGIGKAQRKCYFRINFTNEFTRHTITSLFPSWLVVAWYRNGRGVTISYFLFLSIPSLSRPFP